jgi:hypothetical protein
MPLAVTRRKCLTTAAACATASTLDRSLSRVPNAPSLRKHPIDSDTTTEQLGHVAAEARANKLVLSHLVPGDDPAITDAMWTEAVRKNFSGEIVVGHDLMMI